MARDDKRTGYLRPAVVEKACGGDENELKNAEKNLVYL